jgi:hypothetical protein
VRIAAVLQYKDLCVRVVHMSAGSRVVESSSCHESSCEVQNVHFVLKINVSAVSSAQTSHHYISLHSMVVKEADCNPGF